MLDEVLEAESPVLQRNVARVAPVRHIDLMMMKKRPDRAAQKRREMARHRRDEEHARIILAALARKTPQPAKGRREDLPLHDRKAQPGPGHDLANSVVRPRMGEARKRHELVIGRHAPQWRRVFHRAPLRQNAIGA